MSSSTYGKTLVCFITIFSITQVSPQRHGPTFVNLRNRNAVVPPCCQNISDGLIQEKVEACFKQEENTFKYCKIGAYILVTAKGNQWCVDPKSTWLPARLKRLEKRGISCKMLTKPI